MTINFEYRRYLLTTVRGIMPTEENLQIRFTDLVLWYDEEHDCEHVEMVNELLVKNRCGDDIAHDARDVTPTLWATGNDLQGIM